MTVLVEYLDSDQRTRTKKIEVPAICENLETVIALRLGGVHKIRSITPVLSEIRPAKSELFQTIAGALKP